MLVLKQKLKVIVQVEFIFDFKYEGIYSLRMKRQNKPLSIDIIKDDP